MWVWQGDNSGDGGPATKAELNGPGGLALNSAGDLYIGDFANNRVRRVTASNKVISIVVGNGTGSYAGDGGSATSGEIFGPSGIAVDATGAIYIADFGDNHIRVVTASIFTIAGDGTAGYSGDRGLATDAEWNVPKGVAVGASATLICRLQQRSHP